MTSKKQPARQRGNPIRHCDARPSAPLDETRTCAMSFGAHGHDMLATLRDQLGLPLPIHQYFDHEARVWRRWVRAGESIQVLPSRGGEVEVR